MRHVLDPEVEGSNLSIAIFCKTEKIRKKQSMQTGEQKWYGWEDILTHTRLFIG